MTFSFAMLDHQRQRLIFRILCAVVVTVRPPQPCDKLSPQRIRLSDRADAQ